MREKKKEHLFLEALMKSNLFRNFHSPLTFLNKACNKFAKNYENEYFCYEVIFRDFHGITKLCKKKKYSTTSAAF